MPTPDFNPKMPYLTAGDRERDYDLQHREQLRDWRNKVRCLEDTSEKCNLTARQTVGLSCFRELLRDANRNDPPPPRPRVRL